MTKTIIFDTETSGLIVKHTKYLEDFPHILQLSFIIFDNDTCEIERSYNSYVNAGIPVPEKITELTGITQSMCDGGKPLINVLYDFYYAYLLCDTVVAHNIKFDIKMVEVSIQRNLDIIQKICPDMISMFDIDITIKEQFCTMFNSINDCNIMCECTDIKGNVYKYKKFPKLSEAHEHYFGHVPIGLHNSLIDSLVCLRIYLKQKYGKHISNTEFDTWLCDAL